MGYINTTFAHGNGPYSRCVEWAIAVNDVRDGRGLERLPIVVPLVYPRRQERIMREEISSHVSPSFFEDHPDEVLLDRGQGKLLEKLMFKGKDYSENLEFLMREYWSVEVETQRYLEGKGELSNMNGEVREVDLRDCELQLGLNNRMQTSLPNQFSVSGGAGPFDEVLERAIVDESVRLDRGVMRDVLPIARRMIEGQKIIFSNEPGVFSYDGDRVLNSNEVMTPPFVHPPNKSNIILPRRGIYFLMSGIDGIRESGMYDAVADLGMQIYAAPFSINGLPEKVRDNAIELVPAQINNPKIIAQYARSGWSEVWLSHLSEKGFMTPPHLKTDDPEIAFNLRGIEKLGLGVVVSDNPREDLERAVKLAENVGEYNKSLEKNMVC